jgi:hypothetical protein
MSEKIFEIVKAVLFIAAFVLLMRSMSLRKPDHPWIDYKLPFREGIKFWKFKEYWKPRGYAYYVTSLTLSGIVLILLITDIFISY